MHRLLTGEGGRGEGGGRETKGLGRGKAETHCRH